MLTNVSPTVRISLGLVSATVGLFILADVLFGLSPDRVRPVLEARKQLTETLAVQVTLLANEGDMPAVRTTLQGAVQRHPDVLSAALRLRDGELAAVAGTHDLLWVGADEQRSTPSHARVPILNEGQTWGSLEVRFEALRPAWWSALLDNPFVQAVVFVCFAGFGAYLLFMRRALRHLDPTAVIPGRVRAALDALSEGVVMVDAEEQIVLVNKTFEAGTGLELSGLLARRLSSLPWRAGDPDEAVPALPWLASLADGENRTGERLRLGDDAPRLYAVNAAPVLDDAGRPRGAMVTFDDLTELESAHAELREAMHALERSQREVEQQNAKLEILATRDAMTNCLNRGAFTEQLESLFELCGVSDKEMVCIMTDIDHFKSVNDVFGHAVGDDAIKHFASVLLENARSTDIVGRYGGEEFCVLLYGCSLEEGMEVAESMRAKLEATARERVPALVDRGLTASFGVSVTSLGARTGADLVTQADAALYNSKHAGRNRATAWVPPVRVATAAR